MLKFIIRLDDACESMNEKNWNIMENLLDKYNIKPIVGIIPENRDHQFCFGHIKNFWIDYAKKWQDKGWIIAQHGLYHKYYYYKKGKKKIRTEFYGLDYKTQKDMLEKGYAILKKHKIKVISPIINIEINNYQLKIILIQIVCFLLFQIYL